MRNLRPAFVCCLVVLLFLLSFIAFEFIFKQLSRVERKSTTIIKRSQNWSKVVVNDEQVQDDTIIHRFWSGDFNDRKLHMSLQSALCTQRNARVILWTPTLPPVQNNISSLAIDIRSTTEELVHLASSSPLHSCSNALRDSSNVVAYSDLVRFVALYFYGGIYADVDMVFLKDMRSFHGHSFAFKWDLNVDYYNTAVMGLPRHSAVVPKIIAHFGGRCDPATFWPETINTALGCNGKIMICPDLIMMPTALFAPVSAPVANYQWQNNEEWNVRLHTTTDWFFNQPRMWDSLDHFYPGAYTFHWHNQWKLDDIHPESFFSQFERKYSSGCSSDRQKKKRTIFVDLGGYTGDTMVLYGKSKTWDAVYVFEIDPVKVAAILDRLNNDADLKQVTHVLNAAAWNTDTVLQNVLLTGHNDGHVGGGTSQVLAYDIGQWFHRQHITAGDYILLKIDIEGAEIEVCPLKKS